MMTTTTDFPGTVLENGQAERVRTADDFVYDVDGTTYHSKRRKITGAEIMAAAKIPLALGLVRLFPDGTTATVAPDEEVDLEPDPRFKRRPRFKRG